MFAYLFSLGSPYVSLEKCTNFDEARLDQRFEIMDESVASICSKFARSKFTVFLRSMTHTDHCRHAPPVKNAI